MLYREYKIHYIACVGSLIFVFPTRVDLCEKFSSNLSKVHFDCLVHMFRYIRDNKNLGLKYARIEDSHLSNLLRQASIKTENQMMLFSDSICQDCPDNGRRTGAYIVLYQGGPIDHCTHVTGPVAQSSDESEYNASCTALLSPANFRMLNNILLKKDPDVVPEQAPLILLDIKSAI